MSGAQKVIKYAAIAFGAFLAFTIISAIVGTVLGIVGVGVYWDGTDTSIEAEVNKVEYSEVFEGIDELEIKTGISDFRIIEGTQWKVEGSNLTGSFSAKKQGDTLIVEEKQVNFLGMGKKSSITITIPSGKRLESVELEMGAGRTRIASISAKEITLELGAGSVEIDKLQASEAKIKGGAGRVKIENGNINDLKLEAGVGKLEFTGQLTGDNKIDCGVGKLELNLKNSKTNYQIHTKTGIGSITLNDKKCIDNGVYGEGNTRIKVNGGVGSAEITTVEK